MRDKEQEFARETTVSFDGINFQQGTVGEKLFTVISEPNCILIVLSNCYCW